MFFTTSTGYIRLAPHDAREGNLIYVIVGADVPFLLRPYEDGFELVGDVYAQGIIDGEVLEMKYISVRDLMIR